MAVPPITAQLRAAMKRYNKYSSMTMPCESQAYVKTDAETFDRMCDAIDAIHAQLELDYKIACRVGQNLAEHCENILALPKDADGVPIRIGDVMEWPDGDDEPFEVVGIGENGTLFYMYDDSCEWTNAKNKVHHVPTVEDVLRDFARAMNENLGMYTGEAIDADEWRKADERTIADYAAKLKLAE